MRKILMMVLIGILLLIGYLMVFNGVKVFGFEIVSMGQIKAKSDTLETKLQQVGTLTSTTYPKAVKDLEEATKQLLIAKSNYADAVTYSSTDEINAATQVEKYEVEYLWTAVGRHATKNGVTIKMDIKTSSSGTPKQYDLAFSATGKYVSITEFIAALENDSSLGFKIEDFKLGATANSTEVLQATFTVKDVEVNVDTLSSKSNTTNNVTGTQQQDTTNNTVTNTAS